MSRLSHLSTVALLPVVLGLGVFSMTGRVAQPAFAGGGADGTRCELRFNKRGGSTVLEGFVITPSAISGSYRISATAASGSGGSDVDQSGAFSAGPGGPVSLGVVSLGTSAASYNAELTVKWNGISISCSERAGGKG
jgi:hypothetical protein